MKNGQSNIVVQQTRSNRLLIGVRFLAKRVPIGIALRFLEFRMFLLQRRMRLLKFRMAVCKARVICLKRGYLAPDEGNLASRFRYVRAVLNKPVQCFNAFLECWHNG